jgi:hypothetical protein
MYGTIFGADLLQKEQSQLFGSLFLLLPVDLQDKILDVNTFNNRTASLFLQLNTEWLQKIKKHRAEQVKAFNAQHPVKWFHIYQANICEEDIKFTHRNKQSFKIDFGNESILINPSTVLFDCSGNYAKGFSNDLGEKLHTYTFHYPSYTVVAVSASATSYECDKSIYDAVTDTQRTLCFLLIRPSSSHHMNAFILAHNNDMEARIVNWRGRTACPWHNRISDIDIKEGQLIIDTGFEGYKTTINNNGTLSAQ